MDDFTRNILLYVILPTIVALGAWFMKAYVERVNNLEREVQTKTTESEVRIIMADKIDPMREDIHELKASVDKILDILLKKIN
jgi:inactivated superfamily I helicase